MTHFSLHKVAFVAWALVGLGVCGSLAARRTINPLVIDDARTAARVKTAILNDRQLGLRSIEVAGRPGRCRTRRRGRVGGGSRSPVDARPVGGRRHCRSFDGADYRVVHASTVAAPPQRRVLQTEAARGLPTIRG